MTGSLRTGSAAVVGVCPWLKPAPNSTWFTPPCSPGSGASNGSTFWALSGPGWGVRGGAPRRPGSGGRKIAIRKSRLIATDNRRPGNEI